MYVLQARGYDPRVGQCNATSNRGIEVAYRCHTLTLAERWGGEPSLDSCPIYSATGESYGEIELCARFHSGGAIVLACAIAMCNERVGGSGSVNCCCVWRRLEQSLLAYLLRTASVRYR